MKLASHADVLRGSSRVPAPRVEGTRDEPLRTSAWEATVKQAYADGVLIVEYENERKSARRMGRKHLDTCPHVLACFHGFFFPLAKQTANYSGYPPVLKYLLL